MTLLIDDLAVDLKIDYFFRHSILGPNGFIQTKLLGSGTASPTTFLRGDQTFAVATPTTMPIPVSYIVFISAGTTFAVNGLTGTTDFSNADSATVIQSAINNLPSGGVIFLKAATYSLSAAIDISDKTIYILGEHRFNTILQRAGDVVKILNVTGVTGLSAQQSVSNLTIDGVNNSGIGLNISRIFRCHFDNLVIKNCATGINLDQTIQNAFINPFILACTIGMTFNTTVSTTASFNNTNVVVAGEINNGNPCVLIYGTAASNKFFGTTLEGGQTTQLIIKTAFLTANNQDAVPNGNVIDGCWFETAGVVAPVHIDIQKDAASTNFPWSNVITNSYFAADQNYTAINFEAGNRDIFSSNHLSGPVGQTATITIGVGGNDNIVAFNSVALNTLAISNSGSRNLLKTNFGFTTFLTVLSGTFAIDSTGVKTINIAHGLALTPNVQDCSITFATPTATDFIGSLWIDSTNGTNVVAKVNIGTASVTVGATAKLALRVGKP